MRGSACHSARAQRDGSRPVCLDVTGVVGLERGEQNGLAIETGLHVRAGGLRHRENLRRIERHGAGFGFPMDRQGRVVDTARAAPRIRDWLVSPVAIGPERSFAQGAALVSPTRPSRCYTLRFPASIALSLWTCQYRIISALRLAGLRSRTSMWDIRSSRKWRRAPLSSHQAINRQRVSS